MQNIIRNICIKNTNDFAKKITPNRSEHRASAALLMCAMSEANFRWPVMHHASCIYDACIMQAAGRQTRRLSPCQASGCCLSPRPRPGRDHCADSASCASLRLRVMTVHSPLCQHVPPAQRSGTNRNPNPLLPRREIADRLSFANSTSLPHCFGHSIHNYCTTKTLQR